MTSRPGPSADDLIVTRDVSVGRWDGASSPRRCSVDGHAMSVDIISRVGPGSGSPPAEVRRVQSAGEEVRRVQRQPMEVRRQRARPAPMARARARSELSAAAQDRPAQAHRTQVGRVVVRVVEARPMQVCVRCRSSVVGDRVSPG
jgi:hypothetical protein